MKRRGDSRSPDSDSPGPDFGGLEEQVSPWSPGGQACELSLQLSLHYLFIIGTIYMRNKRLVLLFDRFKR